MALDNSGHSSEPPFPQFDFNNFMSGLDSWLDSTDQLDNLPSTPAVNHASETAAPQPPQEPSGTPARGTRKQVSNKHAR